MVFLFTISLQTIVSSQYINFLYILGLFIFMKFNQLCSLRTILLIFFYGFYQDLLLNYPFGISSMIFIYFLFFSQLSNIFIGKGGSLFQGYLYLGGLIFYALIEFLYIFFTFNIFLKIDIFLSNIIIVLLVYFLITKVFNSSIGSHVR